MYLSQSLLYCSHFKLVCLGKTAFQPVFFLINWWMRKWMTDKLTANWHRVQETCYLWFVFIPLLARPHLRDVCVTFSFTSPVITAQWEEGGEGEPWGQSYTDPFPVPSWGSNWKIWVALLVYFGGMWWVVFLEAFPQWRYSTDLGVNRVMGVTRFTPHPRLLSMQCAPPGSLHPVADLGLHAIVSVTQSDLDRIDRHRGWRHEPKEV